MATRVPQPEDDQLTVFTRRMFSSFSLQHNVYCVPVDQTEQQRLDQLDEILHQLFQGRTVLPEFSASRSQAGSRRPSDVAVLDCGCGRGAWIERFMDEHGGDCDVTGVDIHFGRAVDEDDDDDGYDDGDDDDESDNEGIQEYVKKRWNLNARFRDDQSDNQLRPESFELINSRLLADGINSMRWQSYIRELKYMLKPGGWLQIVEIEPLIQSSTGRLDDNSHLTRWWQWYSSMMHRMDKNPRIGRELRQRLETEGFSHVQSGSIDLAIGSWRSGQESLGDDNLQVVSKMLMSLSLWPFLRVGGMSAEQYRALLTGAASELRDPSKKLYYKVHFAYGQRPRRR